MSDKPLKPEQKSPAADQNIGFECALEVTELLNCVAAKRYNELKCAPLLKALRACIEKKVNTRRWYATCHRNIGGAATPCLC